MEFVWSAYAQFIQTHLDEVQQDWNYHAIR